MRQWWDIHLRDDNVDVRTDDVNHGEGGSKHRATLPPSLDCCLADDVERDSIRNSCGGGAGIRHELPPHDGTGCGHVPTEQRRIGAGSYPGDRDGACHNRCGEAVWL